MKTWQEQFDQRKHEQARRDKRVEKLIDQITEAIPDGTVTDEAIEALTLVLRKFLALRDVS